MSALDPKLRDGDWYLVSPVDRKRTQTDLATTKMETSFRHYLIQGLKYLQCVLPSVPLLALHPIISPIVAARCLQLLLQLLSPTSHF